MLDLPGQPRLDKAALVGGCVLLPLRFDAALLEAEVASLPASLWGTTGGRVGVHVAAESIFLRGHAPAEGNLPIEDRAPLALVPYVRQIIETQIPAAPMRCLLARLPAGAVVPVHVDRAPYFAQTLRLHIAVTSHEQAYMLCAGRSYIMRPGYLWALNNNAPHGVWNADDTRERTHLICDFLPSVALRSLLAAGERDLGEIRPEVETRLASAARALPVN